MEALRYFVGGDEVVKIYFNGNLIYEKVLEQPQA